MIKPNAASLGHLNRRTFCSHGKAVAAGEAHSSRGITGSQLQVPGTRLRCPRRHSWRPPAGRIQALTVTPGARQAVPADGGLHCTAARALCRLQLSPLHWRHTSHPIARPVQHPSWACCALVGGARWAHLDVQAFLTRAPGRTPLQPGLLTPSTGPSSHSGPAVEHACQVCTLVP